jgi:hypothetical protein
MQPLHLGGKEFNVGAASAVIFLSHCQYNVVSEDQQAESPVPSARGFFILAFPVSPPFNPLKTPWEYVD